MAAIRPVSAARYHEWTDARRLLMRDVGAIDHIKCKNCARDFILIESTEAIQAVDVSIVSFWILSPEVTERWLCNCPGERLATDEYDRMRRVRELTFA